MTALAAVFLHVIHLAVILLREPIIQVLLVLLQIHIGDPDLLEAEIDAPRLDIAG
jgi:hypothetical protein